MKVEVGKKAAEVRTNTAKQVVFKNAIPHILKTAVRCSGAVVPVALDPTLTPESR